MNISLPDELKSFIVSAVAFHATGSPRYSHELNIPQLQFWLLRRFPFALLYIEHGTNLDVIRLVHLHRDIPVSLREVQP